MVQIGSPCIAPQTTITQQHPIALEPEGVDGGIGNVEGRGTDASVPEVPEDPSAEGQHRRAAVPIAWAIHRSGKVRARKRKEKEGEEGECEPLTEEEAIHRDAGDGRLGRGLLSAP